MAVLKCKMCGGDLHPVEGASAVECEYCGSMQTVAIVDNEKKANLFNRANRLRMASEFDKAAGVYESIVSEFPEEAEAYWGLCLCAYGIEYVDDPGTGKKIPTCHRTLPESILDCGNFDMACEYADSVAKKIYREEAKAIDRLQRDTLAIVASEEPYDVFICYKETGEDGQRTEDSVLGQDIYDALTAKGMKVFFARISLEDKLGRQYEPYIYSALHSAKVMLAIGTKFEHYDAVWVKNEWGRYLDMASKDKTKTLIPCYKGIDAYDIPKEFRSLQAQDMGKLGWLQDLVRGVQKLCGKEDAPKPQPVQVIQQVQAGGNPATDSLVKRGMMAIEDGDWDVAKDFFDRALDMDAECAQGYWGKFLVEKGCPDLVATVERYIKAAENSLERKIVPATKPDVAHIDEIMKQYAVDPCLSEREIRVMYSGLEEYFSSLSYWQESADLIRKILSDDKNLIRARRFATGNFKQELEAMEAAGEQRLQQHLQEMEQAEKQEAEALRARYPQLLAEVDMRVKKRHETALKMKQYEHLWDTICAGDNHSMGVDIYGLVEAKSKSYNENDCCAVTDWYNIVSISVGGDHVVGLKGDGTVVATGKERDVFGNETHACDVGDWSDIIAVSAGGWHTVGLKSDGTVVAVGRNTDGNQKSCGQCNVSTWRNIIAICAGEYNTFGVKSDGTVVAVGDNSFNQRSTIANWTDIVAVSAGHRHTVGLRADGTVVATGENEDYKGNHIGKCDVESWRDIAAVSAGRDHTVGLKIDGTVVAEGKNSGGACNVSRWRDIVAISAGEYNTIGLKADGTVLVTGYPDSEKNHITDWCGIRCEAKKIALEKKKLELLQVQLPKLQKELKDAEDLQENHKTELANLRGLFTGKRRKELEEQIETAGRRIQALRTQISRLESTMAEAQAKA